MPRNSRAGMGDVILTLLIASFIVIAAAFIAGGYSFRFHSSNSTASPRRFFPFLIPAPTATSTQQGTTTTPQ